MADISAQIQAINQAHYGEEVRGSIVTALTAVNNQVESDTASAAAYATAAASSAADAAQTASELESAITAAEQTESDIEAAEALRVTAENNRVSAESDRADAEAARVEAENARADAATNYVAQARQYAEQCETFTTSDYAINAQSWAVGETGTRYGEDTNNAKYWCGLASTIVTEGGVSSFNGRTGNIEPTAGDYSASQITRGTGSAESALTAIESGIGTTTLPTTAQTLTGAIAEHESDITALNNRFVNKENVSLNTLTTSGLYYCTGCSDTPSPPFTATVWAVEVIAHASGNAAKQIAHVVAADGWKYERHLTLGEWSSWEKLPTPVDITALNGNFEAVSWSTLTDLPLSNCSVYQDVGVKCCKRGNLVHLYISVSGLTANSRVQIATLPSGWRPLVNTPFLGVGGLSYSNLVYGTVSGAGAIYVQSTDTYATAYFCFIAT